MQRPVVVGSYEIPMLSRHAVRNWVVLDVFDGAVHFIGVVEEDFPTTSAPRWVIFRTESISAKPRAAEMLEIVDHFFGAMFVFADDQVDVIEEDGAGVARVLG